jgi:hypothetical protein
MALKYQIMGYLKSCDRIEPGFFDAGRIGGFGDLKTVDASLQSQRAARELIVVDPVKDAKIAAFVSYARAFAFHDIKGVYVCMCVCVFEIFAGVCVCVVV